MAEIPENVNYINQSGCITIDDVDDRADHFEANAAFSELGFSQGEQDALYTMIAGILHFGNISFEANDKNTEESLISINSEVWLARATEMFGVDAYLLKQALLFKKIKSGNSRRTSIAYASYLPSTAMENKNALAKEIYRRCFDWIVNRINVLMGNDNTTASSMIGILDIFGFEIFQKVCSVCFVLFCF
jgi:myosin heavy subunit